MVLPNDGSMLPNASGWVCGAWLMRDKPQAEAAARLGVNEGAVKVAIHRVRRRFREVIKNEIGQTVSDPAQVDLELHYLLEALL